MNTGPMRVLLRCPAKVCGRLDFIIGAEHRHAALLERVVCIAGVLARFAATLGRLPGVGQSNGIVSRLGRPQLYFTIVIW
jgi:hypothetical protein